jgi:hypothetical protein
MQASAWVSRHQRRMQLKFKPTPCDEIHEKDSGSQP